MPAKIIGTCSLCKGPVAIIEPWAGTMPCVPTCQRCGARKKDPFGPTIEMEPYKGLPGTLNPKWDFNEAWGPSNPLDWKIGSPTCTIVASEGTLSFKEAVQEAINELKKNSPT